MEQDTKQRIKALCEGVNDELMMLDAELQRRMSNIRKFMKEINYYVFKEEYDKTPKS